MELTLKDIELAEQRLEHLVHKTELSRSTTFSNMAGADVYLKCENRQKTGSFKIRGAGNKLAALAEEGNTTSVVASSAGNHAQGVACAASGLGIRATIVMPKTAPIAKVSATEGYGAKVVLHGDVYDDAYAKAMEICENEGATFLHPFNDLEVIAGQGTVALEILRDLPTVDIIVVPAGGGGLLAGIAACIKQINPRIQVVGVQAEGANAIYQSFHAKGHISTDRVATIADGIAVKSPGDMTVELINRYVDDMVTVSDNDISSAILLLMERSKELVEPAGACSLAAVLSGKIDVAGKKVACVLSGGNIDVGFVPKIIEQGLMSRHRRLKFRVKLADAPGNLGKLLQDIANESANILTISHDRLSLELNPNEINVHVACEVSGKKHGEDLIKTLKKNGYDVKVDQH